MVCDRCGNKLAPNTSVCKLCGYDNNDTDEEKIINVEVEKEAKIEVKDTKKENFVAEKRHKELKLNNISLYGSLLFMILPIIAIGLIYYIISFSVTLVISTIIAIVIQIVANYMFISNNKSEKLENTISKGMLYLSFFILTFATAMVVAAYALKQQEIIVTYSNIFISCISVSLMLLNAHVSMKLLRKYS